MCWHLRDISSQYKAIKHARTAALMDAQTVINLTLGTLSLALSAVQVFFSWQCIIILQHKKEDVFCSDKSDGEIGVKICRANTL
ncbi:hypothetical protein K458DRAFT_412243 [Lentithecium fluviatile CBS 122367]|uniref:Uncharacterized protein n=1 Tax=Lentithecium fluviatile CBS 122367 TaxID=1168545 RepID=A0A6G1JKF4_9PLEO|nr:hypothetical protein K458DRAFT_412243 [Lentithecium fluviatile CBS 122367]